MKEIQIKYFILAVVLNWNFVYSQDHEYAKEYIPYDGWYNNRAHPEWGSADGPLTRRVPSHYKDGVYAPSGDDRPNPRKISQETMAGNTGHGSVKKRTALLVFFGQQVVEEILDAQRSGCPPEYFNIKIPKGDPLYDKEGTGTKEIPLLRSRYDAGITGYSPNNPRQQLNEITPWIDGGLTYGITKAWADALRLHKTDCPSRKDNNQFIFHEEVVNATDCRGELISLDEMGHLPAKNDIGLPLANPPPPRDYVLKESKRFFRIGNPRGNENPFLLTFGILWFRHHNYLAMKIREKHSDWSDERVYNEARVQNIAVHQKIVLYDWLPQFLGECDTRHNADNILCKEMPKYDGYKSSVHPGVTHVFQSAAMRFGHTLVPPGVFRRSKVDPDTMTCSFINTTIKTSGGRHDLQEQPALRTCNTYWNSIEAIEESNIHPLLMGMSSQICEREDNIITPDLRGSVFGFLDFIRRDLMAINIQRGRDHGLPDYNTARISYGMKKIDNFEDINPVLMNRSTTEGEALLQRLIAVHEGDISKMDVWTGGLMETQPEGPGELFREIIRDQFQRIRDGDRFWYENRGNGLLSDEEFAEINSTTIRDVILRVNPIMTNIDIQDNPFVFNNDPSKNEHCPQPFQLSEFVIANCTEPRSFDYFTGSEVSYALTFTFFGLFIIATICLMVALGRQQDTFKQQLRKKEAKSQRSRKNKQTDLLFPSSELISSKSSRDVQIKFGPGRTISVQSPRGQLLRTIDLNKFNKFLIATSYDNSRKTMFVRPHGDIHDLILSFPDEEERMAFNRHLNNFLERHRIEYEISNISYKLLIDQAVTKKTRDDKLKKFFKSALGTVLKMQTADSDVIMSNETARKYIHFEITRREFAEYFNMKEENLFVQQMFNTADIDNSGTISFREFLDILILFTKGGADDKARLMFNMYDLDGSGQMDMGEFTLMLKSMMEMVNQKVESDQLNNLVQTMLKSHGLQNKYALDFDDFKRLMDDYKDELDNASLDTPENTASTPNDGPVNRNRAYTRIQRARQTVKRYQNASEANGGGSHIRQRNQRNTHLQVKVFEKKTQKEGTLEHRIQGIVNYIQNYRYHIFWLALYLLVTASIFAERAYFYSVEREFAGLRRIAGYGVSMTRGAASAMMFTYCSLLVTMCRNTITLLRETFLHRYIPFDSAVTFHRIIAWSALLFTVVHILGHSVNIYSISTQPIFDLACLFRDYWRQSHELPKFHYWCWQTITGITGVILTLIIIVM